MDTASSRIYLVSCVLAALALWLVLELHLLPALLAGLLVYELVATLTPQVQRLVPGIRAHWLVVGLLGAVVVGLLLILVFGAIAFVGSEAGSPAQLFERLMPVIDRAREQLPAALVAYLPDSIEEVRIAVLDWLRTHATQLQLAGKEAVRVTLRILIGLALGALVALDGARATPRRGPLAIALAARAAHFAGAFRHIVFAQIKISAINTAFTGIFLLGALPLAGVHLPLAKTLVAVTFVVGLLPVIGNLISNTLIFVVALSLSLGVAIAALVFLILIHKLEYLLNARIMGLQIGSRAWELLLAMLAMEAAFGLPGLVAAPIYYAYLKRELEAARLI